MSDRERRSVSRSPSYSGGDRSPGLVSDRDSASPRSDSPKGNHKKSKSVTPRSRTRSRSHSYRRSRSRSRTPVRRRSRTRSRSRDRRYYSRSRSRSPGYRRRRGYRRSRSRSPMSSRRRHKGNREDPLTSRCVGVFGLSLYTQERDLREFFSHYGPIDEVQIVYDHQTGRSRGFGFVYYRNLDDAVDAKERAPGTEIDGRKIRVDYSITERAHTPTPGIYLGKPTSRGYRSSRRSPSPGYSRRYSSRYSRSRSRSRSYSPRGGSRYSYY